jgi:2-haloacid dehalogenase
VTEDDAAELTNRFATMPPHPEVPAALRRLGDHGFRLFTLTDNTLAISGRQLEHAGVIDVFERRFSVDETVRRHKPAREAYESVAAALQIEPSGICLIACHVWDTIGAQAAGWQAGLIRRVRARPARGGPQPDYIRRAAARRPGTPAGLAVAGARRCPRAAVPGSPQTGRVAARPESRYAS